MGEVTYLCAIRRSELPPLEITSSWVCAYVPLRRSERMRWQTCGPVYHDALSSARGSANVAENHELHRDQSDIYRTKPEFSQMKLEIPDGVDRRSEAWETWWMVGVTGDQMGMDDGLWWRRNREVKVMESMGWEFWRQMMICFCWFCSDGKVWVCFSKFVLCCGLWWHKRSFFFQAPSKKKKSEKQPAAQQEEPRGTPVAVYGTSVRTFMHLYLFLCDNTA